MLGHHLQVNRESASELLCLVTPRELLRRHRIWLEQYRRARDHLEHLTERFPGQPRTDWRGDANAITGTVAGVRRDGFFVFQREEWNITDTSIAQLSEIVSALVDGIGAEVKARLDGYLRGESAIWKSSAR